MEHKKETLYDQMSHETVLLINRDVKLGLNNFTVADGS